MTKIPLDHLRSKKKPVRKSVWIAGDSELADELSELEASLTREKSRLEIIKPDSPLRGAAVQTVVDLEDKVATMQATMRENSIKFVFQSIGTKNYEALLAKHPPTEEQLKELKTGDDPVPFNPETFPVALIAACTVEPESDVEELEAWLHDDSWNSFEIMALFQTALEVNQSRRILNLGKG